jgi:hypothetical protein
MTLVCGGWAIAQPWPAVPHAQLDQEPVYLIRTAGQSDRRVKVVRPNNPSDPAAMAEVKDVATGETFVIPGRVLAKLPRAGGAPSAESKPTPTATPTPVSDVSPQSVSPVPVHDSPLPKVNPTPPIAVAPAAVEPPKTAPPTRSPLPTVTVEFTVQASAPSALTPVPPEHRSQATAAPLPNVLLPVATHGSVAADPWRSSTGHKVAPPTPPTSPPTTSGPKLVPVPTWRATPLPVPAGVNDPWKRSGGD